jgi:hypothetical protein
VADSVRGHCNRAESIPAGWIQPRQIADSGCNRTCLGTKVGIKNFVRQNIKVILGNDGKTWMMARGYGDIGDIRAALFVPGLKRDLISTSQLDIDGMSESTVNGVKIIWAGAIGDRHSVANLSKDFVRIAIESYRPSAQRVAEVQHCAGGRGELKNLLVIQEWCD